jgi:hypothetical protein
VDQIQVAIPVIARYVTYHLASDVLVAGVMAYLWTNAYPEISPVPLYLVTYRQRVNPGIRTPYLPVSIMHSQRGRFEMRKRLHPGL